VRSPPAIDGTLLNTGQRRAAARWRRSLGRHELFDLSEEGEVPPRSAEAIAIREGAVRTCGGTDGRCRSAGRFNRKRGKYRD